MDSWSHFPGRTQIEAVVLRDLYRTLEEPGANPLRVAQSNLDAAYGILRNVGIFAFLLALNQTCAARETAGERITPPALPLPVKEHGKFITGDCIRV